MLHDPILGLEADIHRCIGGPLRRWTRDGYAQGVLLDLLEGRGYQHEFLPSLELPGGETVAGSQFRAHGQRSFTAFHPIPGVALVMAAGMVLRTTGRCRAVVVA